MKMPIYHLLVYCENPDDLEECGSEVKVTGVKTLSFLVHFRLVWPKSQNIIAATAMKVPINQPLVSLKNYFNYFESRSKVKVTGVKTQSFTDDF